MQTPIYDEQGRRLFELEDGSRILRNWPNLVAGLIPLEELDEEELAKMGLRGRDGFVRPGGKLVPRALHDQKTRILLGRVREQFEAYATKATQVFLDVIEDPNAAHADKMRAAEYLQNRFMGKTPDKIEVQAEVKPWEGLVAGVLRDGDEVRDTEPEQG